MADLEPSPSGKVRRLVVQTPSQVLPAMEEGGSDALPKSPCLWKDCEARFATKEELYLHLCTRHAGQDAASGDKQARLTCCWEGCSDELTCSGGITCPIVEHFIGHSKLFPFVCGIFSCRLSFKSHSAIMDHMNVAHGVQLAVVHRPQVTPGAAQRRVVEMRWGVPLSGRPTSEKLICRWTSCGRVFNTASELQLHFDTHHRPPRLPEVVATRTLRVPEIPQVIEMHGDHLKCPFCAKKCCQLFFAGHMKKQHGYTVTLPSACDSRKPVPKRKLGTPERQDREKLRAAKKPRREELPGHDVVEKEISSDSDTPLIRRKGARKQFEPDVAAKRKEGDSDSEEVLDPELFASCAGMLPEARVAATPETDDVDDCLDPKLFEDSSASMQKVNSRDVTVDSVHDLRPYNGEPEEDWSLR